MTDDLTKRHLNYLRRKTADEAELWAADRIEQLEFSWAGCSQQLKDACADLSEVKRERDALRADNAELVAALKPFGAIDLVESRVPAEFAMLVLRARAAIAKVRKP